MFCREQAARYEAESAAFEAAGARLVAVGNGTAAMARDFVEKFGIGFDVVTAPDLEAYRKAGLQRGLNLGLDTFKAGFRALKRGHLQGATKGDALQQGGVLIVGPGDTLHFAHADTGPGDHVEPQAALHHLPAPAGEPT
ncbi:MAG: AhpC/TSA family protein [Myxococcota bacterium]